MRHHDPAHPERACVTRGVQPGCPTVSVNREVAGIETMLEAEHKPTVRDVHVAEVDLRVFDQLFSEQEVLQ